MKGYQRLVLKTDTPPSQSHVKAADVIQLHGSLLQKIRSLANIHRRLLRKMTSITEGSPKVRFKYAQMMNHESIRLFVGGSFSSLDVAHLLQPQIIYLLPRTTSSQTRDDFDRERYHAPLYSYLRMHQVHQNAGPLLGLLLASPLDKRITIRPVFCLHNHLDDRHGHLGTKQTVSRSIHRKGQVRLTSKSVSLRLPPTVAPLDHLKISVYMRNFVEAPCRHLGPLRIFPFLALFTMMTVH
jgi:hypothetical protein